MLPRLLSLLAVGALASACAHHDMAPASSTPQGRTPIEQTSFARAPSTQPVAVGPSPGAGASPGTTWESITSNTPPSASPTPPPPDVVSVGLMTIGADATPPATTTR